MPKCKPLLCTKIWNLETIPWIMRGSHLWAQNFWQTISELSLNSKLSNSVLYEQQGHRSFKFSFCIITSQFIFLIFPYITKFNVVNSLNFDRVSEVSWYKNAPKALIVCPAFFQIYTCMSNYNVKLRRILYTHVLVKTLV